MGSSWSSMVHSFSTSACCCKRTSSPPPPATDATRPPQISDPSQLNRFIQYIQDLLDAIKMGSSHQSASTSAEFIEHVKFAGKTMEKISTEAEQFKNNTNMLASKLPEEARRAVIGSLIGLAQLHWIGVAFSFVAFVLERMDRVSSNRADCIKLLEKIIDLAKILQKLNERMSDDEETSERLKQAIHTIVEGAIICCCYMRGRKIFRYLKAVTVGESLKSTRDTLRDLTSELNLLVSVNIQAQQPLRKLQSQNILRISDPVGLSGPCEKVKELLDMDGRGSAKAVIIYGFGGVGKTTLAEYVVSELPLNGLKLCVIRIEDENFDIIKLQKQILFDVGGKNIELRDRMEGHKKLARVLKEQLCFLFIDNVVKKRQVEDLLPQEFCLPSRSRMLITSRNSDVKEVLSHNIGCKEYRAGCLLPEEAKQLLHKIVFNNVDQVTADDELKIKDIEEEWHKLLRCQRRKFKGGTERFRR